MTSGQASPDPVLEQAMAWRAEAADPAMPAHRVRALEAWLRLPAHARAYRQAEQVWSDLGWSQVLNEEALKVEMLRRPKGASPAVATSTRRRWLAAGAGLAAAGMAGAVLGPKWLAAAGGGDPAGLRLATAVGEIRQVTLEDGSRLSLGGETTAVVRLARTRRTVDILSGDAWFEVAPDPDRPFSVRADGLTATALGTVFEVRRNPRGVQVAVVEGRVRVEAGNGAEPVVLAGGQGVRRLADGVLRPFDVAVAGAGRWRQQRFAYRNVPLSEMVEDLNRYHPPGVRLARPGLGELRISAAFRLDQLDTALNGVALSHELTVTRTADGGFVLG